MIVEVLNIIIVNLLLATALFYILKGPEFLFRALPGALMATIFGGVFSYLGLILFAPTGADPLTAGVITGSIAAMWSSLFTAYFCR